MVFASALAAAGMLAWSARLYCQKGSLHLYWGMLPNAKSSFLDGSNGLFQHCSWHLGNGTRTWGETYGIRFRRPYLNVEVKHLNPNIHPAEARDED
jgi:hypothetical protein